MGDRTMEARTDKQNGILMAFSRALGREAHVLSLHPALLWQQMYNRLQWEGEAAGLLASELGRRNAPHSKPWIKLRTPLRESASLVRTFEGHQKPVSTVAHSPDGQWIASVSEDNTLCLWEIATGQIVREFKIENGPLFSFAYSPDGKYLACATHEGELKLYHANTGLPEHTLKIDDFVITFAFSADWRLLVTPGSDFTLHLWEISSGRMLRSFRGHTSFVIAFTLSPDGRSLASAGYDEHAIWVWDTATGQLQNTLEGHQKRVLACAFSPDGRFIASTSEDNTLRVWDAATGRELWRQGSITKPRWCTFSPDGRYVGSSYWGNALRIWDTPTGEMVCTFDGHTKRVSSGAFLPDGRYIVSASGDHTLRLWEITTTKDQPKEVEVSGDLKGCTYSPDGCFVNFLVDSDSLPDHSVHQVNASTGESLRGYYRKSASDYEECVAYAFSPDRQLIVSSSGDNAVQVWEAASEQTLHKLAGHTERGTTCAFSPDSQLIVSGSWDCTLRLWEAATGRLRRTLQGHQGWINACAFSPDGSLILSASTDESLHMWDTASGKALRILKGHLGAVMSCVFSPDGQLVLSASQDNTLRLWHTNTGSLLRTLEGHTSHVTDCAFSPDGSLLASASLDKTLRIWSATSDQEISRLPLPGALHTLGMHPYRPEMVCGAEGGLLYRQEFIGYRYGPIIVTPRKSLSGCEVLCPACQQRYAIGKDQPGSQITCPTGGCGLQLKINPFIDQSAKDKKHWLPRLIKN